MLLMIVVRIMHFNVTQRASVEYFLAFEQQNEVSSSHSNQTVSTNIDLGESVSSEGI